MTAIQYVRSVPGELNMDKNSAMEAAQVCVCVCVCVCDLSYSHDMKEPRSVK